MTPIYSAIQPCIADQDPSYLDDSNENACGDLTEDIDLTQKLSTYLADRITTPGVSISPNIDPLSLHCDEFLDPAVLSATVSLETGVHTMGV
jgi:hypothetical protein